MMNSIPNKIASLAAGTGMILMLSIGATVHAAESFCPKGTNPDPAVIWCDGFEQSDVGPKGTINEKYFEFNTQGGSFGVANMDAIEGNQALRARWQAGQVNAGHFILNFGRNPLRSQTHTSSDFRDIYWRFYIKLQDGFSGYPSKTTRITSFANTSWSQAMIGHIWAYNENSQYLSIDPVSGIDNYSNLKTTKYNDFSNFTWLGKRPATTPLKAGKWHCVEGHVKLNSPGAKNGVFELWLDEQSEARRTDYDFVKAWTNYGLNALSFENYWNSGSPKQQERYMDALVVSTKRIGCLGSAPKPPVLIETR